MQISDTVREILTKNSVKIPDEEYSGNDLLIIYEKVIVFLNKKLSQALIESNVDDDDSTEEDLNESFENVMADIETMIPAQISSVYSAAYFKKHSPSINYQTATLLCEHAKERGYAIQQLWTDIHINSGRINTLGV